MNPDNGLPQLPSFKSSQQSKKEEKKAPGLPSAGGKEMPSFLRSAPKGSAPALRVRGLGGGTSLMERLKSLQKKDIAFIAAGLSVLVMAPLAEHFLMSPEDQAGQLQKGFSTNASFPGDVGSVYDPGVGGGMSPGGLLGQGSDVITPLNVRDPSALIMGPGAAQKPSAIADTPAAPGKADNSAWKDALAAAQKGAATATRKASLPMPHPKLAAGLRGLGAIGGGGGGSFTLPAISATNAPNRAAGSRSLQSVTAAPGYKGAAGRALASGGGPEALKNAGNAAASHFNQGGSAAGALDQAAREAIPKGGGFGGPGGGEDGKSPGSGSAKTDKTLGESLEFLRQKMEMEKALELKWKKKNWYEFERQKMIEESVIKSAIDNLLGKGIFEPIGKMMADGLGSLVGSDPPMYCYTGGIVSSDNFRGTISTSKFKECRKGVSSGKDGVSGPLCDDINRNVVKCAGGGDDPGGGTKPNPNSDQNVTPVVPPGGNPPNPNTDPNAPPVVPPASGSNGNLVNPSAELNSAGSALLALRGRINNKKATIDDVLSQSPEGRSKMYEAGLKSLQAKLAKQGEAVDSMIAARDKLSASWKSIVKGTTKVQDELSPKSGAGLNAANGNLTKATNDLAKVREALKQKEAAGDFEVSKEAQSYYKNAQDELKATEQPLQAAEKLVVPLNQDIQDSAEAVEGKDGSRAKLAAAGTILDDPSAPAQVTDQWATPYQAQLDAVNTITTDAKAQLDVLNNNQQQAYTVRTEELMLARAYTQKYVGVGAQDFKFVGSNGETNPNIRGSAAGYTQDNAVWVTKFTKGQLAVNDQENLIIQDAQKKWTQAMSDASCATLEGRKACVENFNTQVLPTVLQEKYESLTKANETASQTYETAKGQADKIGTSVASASAPN